MDVAVAGVGVAGAFTLRALSKNLEVVGIDKREKLGYPVECGEIIPTKKEMKELLPDLHDYSLFDIPKNFENNRTRVFDFILPNGRTFNVEFDMHVVNRDRMIESVAVNSGHKLILKTRVTDMNGRELNLSDGTTISPEVIAACDGANSRIAKKLGIWNYTLVPAKQYYMKDAECEEDTIYMYIGNEIAPGGYAWIIPKGDGFANVGIGFVRKRAKQGDNIHKALDRFVREYPHSSKFLKNAEVVHKIGAVVPVDMPLERTVYGNILMVGDSASMIISHVGAGIPTSMVAGDLAGDVINQYFEGGRLEKFDIMWKVSLLAAIERSYFIKTLWDRICEDDKKISRYLRFTTSGDMGQILRSRVPFKLKAFSFLFPILKHII
jgi:geranylgeranyl reductase family protein